MHFLKKKNIFLFLVIVKSTTKKMFSLAINGVLSFQFTAENADFRKNFHFRQNLIILQLDNSKI